MHKPNCIRLAVALAWRFHSVHNLRRERKTEKRVGESTICIRLENFFWSGSRSISRPTSVLIRSPIESQPPRQKDQMDQRGMGHERRWRRGTSFTGVRIVTRSKSTMIVISAPPTVTFSHVHNQRIRSPPPPPPLSPLHSSSTQLYSLKLETQTQRPHVMGQGNRYNQQPPRVASILLHNPSHINRLWYNL